MTQVQKCAPTAELLSSTIHFNEYPLNTYIVDQPDSELMGICHCIKESICQLCPSPEERLEGPSHPRRSRSPLGKEPIAYGTVAKHRREAQISPGSATAVGHHFTSQRRIT
jgi:hypothetical protein